MCMCTPVTPEYKLLLTCNLNPQGKQLACRERGCVPGWLREGIIRQDSAGRALQCARPAPAAPGGHQAEGTGTGGAISAADAA